MADTWSRLMCQSPKWWQWVAQCQLSSRMNLWGGLLTEWKQGNTSYKKPRNPAFGGVFLFLFLLIAQVVLQYPLQIHSLEWRIERIVTRFFVHSCKGTLSLDARLWIWSQPCGENGRNRIPYPCPKRARWLMLTCFLCWLLLPQWVQFQLHFHFDQSLSIRYVGTLVM